MSVQRNPSKKIQEKNILRASEQNFSKRLLDAVLATNDENVVVSPFSVFTALSMTAVCARNDTLKQMLQVLSLPQDDNLHQQMASYFKSFDKAQQAKIISIANTIFIHHEV